MSADLEIVQHTLGDIKSSARPPGILRACTQRG